MQAIQTYSIDAIPPGPFSLVYMYLTQKEKTLLNLLSYRFYDVIIPGFMSSVTIR